jgi:hypothetical protein
LAEGGFACIGKIPHPLSAYLSYFPYISQRTGFKQRLATNLARSVFLSVDLWLLLYKTIGECFNGASVRRISGWSVAFSLENN